MSRARLEDALARHDDLGIMAHLVAGFPDAATTFEAARAVEAGGAEILELQFPFSDPLADGPTVIGACQTALDAGFRHRDFLTLLERITGEVRIPVVVMTYANIAFARGFDAFASDLARAGATGLILPDLPHTEPEFTELHAALRDAALSYVPVIAPTSPPPIVRALGELADDFLYVVVRLGVTGRASNIDEAVCERLAEVAALAPGRPLAAGFGIRSREQVEPLRGRARLAVVGSRIVETIHESGFDAPARVRSLVAELAAP